MTQSPKDISLLEIFEVLKTKRFVDMTLWLRWVTMATAESDCNRDEPISEGIQINFYFSDPFSFLFSYL